MIFAFANQLNVRSRPRAAAVHLSISVLIVIAAAAIVFLLWYPPPFDRLSDGRGLFWLIVSVDVVLGPLITLLIFNTKKPRRELVLDLAVVVALQAGALAYGLWTAFAARPAYLVFEYSRFSIVHAIDIAPPSLARAPEGLQKLPLNGPGLIALRPFKDANEQFDATMAALDGAPLSARTDLWQPYAQSRTEVLAESKPATELAARFPQQSEEIQRAMSATGLPAEQLRYLPVVGRKDVWTVLLNAADAQPLGFVPLDSF